MHVYATDQCRINNTTLFYKLSYTKPHFIISAIGALQGVLLSLLFFLKSKRRPATLMIGLYVFVFSIGLLENRVAENNDSATGKILLAFIANASYLYGPFLYLFVHYLISGITQFRKKHFIHFLPFFIFFTVELFIILSGYEIDRDFADTAELIQFEILVFQLLAYNILAIKKLDRHHKSILDTYSAIEEKDLRWLRLLLFIITGIYVCSFLLSHLGLFGLKVTSSLFIVIQIGITISIYLMSYMVLLRPGIFTFSANQSVEKEPGTEDVLLSTETASAKDEEPPHLSKYKNSGLKPGPAKKYLTELEALMINQKPYKNPELHVHTLSQLLGISKNHLTQILNEELKMNFFEFINMYRIEEAKTLLLNPSYSHLSLTGIAAEAGYKSKTTFFSNFKKITGLTPQEWVKSQQNTGKFPVNQYNLGG